MAAKLIWHGDRYKRRLRRAQMEAVNATMAAASVHAKRHHPWRNRTGILEGSIGIAEYAHEVAAGVRGLWGSLDVLYARFLELGTARNRPYPFLRPAADAEYPALRRRLQRAWRRAA